METRLIIGICVAVLAMVLLGVGLSVGVKKALGAAPTRYLLMCKLADPASMAGAGKSCMWLRAPGKNVPLVLTKNIKQAALFTTSPLGNGTVVVVDFQTRSQYFALDQTMRPMAQLAAASGLQGPAVAEVDARGISTFVADNDKQCIGVDWQLGYPGPKLYTSHGCNAAVTSKLQKLWIVPTSQSCAKLDT
jgi:hypothetical protein